MNKQIRRYLSAVIAMALMFTSVFSNVVLAEEETVGIEDVSADENADLGGDSEDADINGETDEATEDVQDDKDTEDVIEDGALDLAAVTYDDTDISLAAAATYEDFVKQFDTAQGGTPVAVGETKTYTIHRTDSSQEAISLSNGSKEVGGIWFEATASGSKLQDNGVSNGVQVGTNTVLYVPVNGKSNITFTTGYNTATVKVTDELGYDDSFDINKSAWGPDIYEYTGKSTTVVKFTISSGSIYIKTIDAVSEGVQEGPEPVTWEKRDFALNINGTSVNVEGANKKSGSATITIDDTDAEIVSAEAKEASIKLNLGGKALSSDMVSTTTEGIEISVEGDNVVVSFTGQTIEPLTYTISIADYSTEIKSAEEFAAKFDETKGGTPVTVEEEYTYNFGGLIYDGGYFKKASEAGETNKMWVDATTGSGLRNNGDNCQVGIGAVFYIPVNGKTTLTFNTYGGVYGEGTFKISDSTGEYTEQNFSTTGAGDTTDQFVYDGKSKTVIKLDLTGAGAKGFYLKSIKAVSEGVQAGPTWEKRDFALSINGTNVNVEGAATESGSAKITIDDTDASVVLAKAKEASIKLNLGGKALTADMVSTTTEGIATSVEGNNVIVSFTGQTIEPLTYTIKVIDYSTEIKSAEQFAAQFDETKGGTPVAVNEDKIYTLEKTNASDETITYQGNEGVANGVYIDAANGEFSNNGRVGNGAIVKAGTIIYVPVNGTTSFEFSTGFNSANVSVSDSLGFSDGFEIASPSGWLTTTYEYNGKSATVVKFEITSGSLYLRSIKANSKGVQEGPAPVTWEKRDFSVKINGTTVDVVGAENAGSSSAVTLSDENATVILAKAKEAALKLNLEGKTLTADMVEAVSGDITTSVEDGKVIVRAIPHNSIK